MADKQHARLESIETRDGQLTIGGIEVARLAERAGQTPFYAYDRRAVAERVDVLRRHLPERVELHYAIKANPMPALVDFLRPQVDGFDVASQQEMLVALDSGMPPAEISFAGPAKRPPEIRAAIAAGICLNCESATELERIEQQAAELDLPARVALRVNPDFELKGAGMKMSGSPKQFGVDADQAAALMRRAAVCPAIRFEGLHIFCGSQNLNTDAIIEANHKTLELAAALSADSGQPLQTLNLGGGYGIPYFAGDRPIDLAAVGAALAEAFSGPGRALADTRMIVELGRYVVGEAGYYVCRVQDVKISRGQTFVMVDGGLHHHLANSGNFGQILRKNYPVVIGNKLDRPGAGTMSIVGPLCTPLDVVADDLAGPEPQIGDLVVVLQSGAYGFTASPQRFLSHPPPVEILV